MTMQKIRQLYRLRNLYRKLAPKRPEVVKEDAATDGQNAPQHFLRIFEAY
jgi:hypothetical protein